MNNYFLFMAKKRRLADNDLSIAKKNENRFPDTTNERRRIDVIKSSKFRIIA